MEERAAVGLHSAPEMETFALTVPSSLCKRLRIKMFPSCIHVRQQIAQQNAENALDTSDCPGDSFVSTSDLSSRLNQGISEMGGSPLCKTQILPMTNCTGEI